MDSICQRPFRVYPLSICLPLESIAAHNARNHCSFNIRDRSGHGPSAPCHTRCTYREITFINDFNPFSIEIEWIFGLTVFREARWLDDDRYMPVEPCSSARCDRKDISD